MVDKGRRRIFPCAREVGSVGTHQLRVFAVVAKLRQSGAKADFQMNAAGPGTSFAQQHCDMNLHVYRAFYHSFDMDYMMAICDTFVEDQSPLLLSNTAASSSDDPTITMIPHAMQDPSIHTVCKLTGRKRFVQHEGYSHCFPKSMQNILPIPAKWVPFVPVREDLSNFRQRLIP